MSRVTTLCLAVLMAGLVLPVGAQAVDPAGVDPGDEGPEVRVVGRLVLPWGRHDSSRVLSLALRNDSAHYPREFQVVLFRPGGAEAARSGPMPLPPKASVAFSLDDLADSGTWSAGSLEVLYRGPGKGRLVGTARQADLALAQSEALYLVPAGHRVVQTTPDPPDDRKPGER